jgi:hypothetical protein
MQQSRATFSTMQAKRRNTWSAINKQDNQKKEKQIEERKGIKSAHSARDQRSSCALQQPHHAATGAAQSVALSTEGANA